VSAAGSRLQDKLAEMRRQFDESFARPRAGQVAAPERMLAITVAGEYFAVRVAESSGLAAVAGQILPVPSRVPELLGLAGLRGAIVPVFNLAALLGAASARSEPRWALLCGGPAPVGFAFNEMEHQFEADAAQVFPLQEGPHSRYVHEMVRDGMRLRCVIRLGALAEHIRNRRPKSGERERKTG
jgi:purine-binding chemotaxis protein CheW